MIATSGPSPRDMPRRPGAAPTGGSPRSTTGTNPRTPTAATRPTASKPTDAGHRTTGSGSTPRTGRSDPAPTYAARPDGLAVTAHAGRSPRSTNPAGATPALPLLPPRTATANPRVTVTNTATNARHSRTGRLVLGEENDLAGPGQDQLALTMITWTATSSRGQDSRCPIQS